MTRNWSRRGTAISCAAGLLLALGACGSAGSSGGDPPIGISYQVTYKAGTVVLKSADVESGLQSVGSDGTTFTLASDMPGLSQVTAGTVLVLPGIALARVTNVATMGSSVVLTTEAAALTDAVQDGSIQWEQEIGTTGSTAGGAPFARPMSASGVRLQSGIGLTPTGGSYSGSLDGYDYKITLTPGATQVTVDVTVTYKDPNFEVSVEGHGTLSGFRSGADIEVQSGVVQKASVTARNLSGELTLQWAAGKPTPSKSNAEMPITFKIPFKWTNTIPILDGIPIIYSIGADVTLTPLFAGGNSSSQGSLKVPFGGTVTMDLGGGSGSVQASPTIAPSSSTVALAASGFVAGVNFPNVGVGLGFTEANVMMSTALITVATTQTPGGVSGDLCERFDASINWQTNLTAKLFGLSAQSSPKTVYSTTGTFTIPAGATCGG